MLMNNTITAFSLINNEVSDLPLNDNERLMLDRLIEQDKCISEIDFIDGVSVWKKGQEEVCQIGQKNSSYVRLKFREEKIPEQFGGVSFFHKVGGIDWHVRIHRGE
jgi:hypothetical protein